LPSASKDIYLRNGIKEGGREESCIKINGSSKNKVFRGDPLPEKETADERGGVEDDKWKVPLANLGGKKTALQAGCTVGVTNFFNGKSEWEAKLLILARKVPYVKLTTANPALHGERTFAGEIGKDATYSGFDVPLERIVVWTNLTSGGEE